MFAADPRLAPSPSAGKAWMPGRARPGSGRKFRSAGWGKVACQPMIMCTSIARLRPRDQTAGWDCVGKGSEGAAQVARHVDTPLQMIAFRLKSALAAMLPLRTV